MRRDVAFGEEENPLSRGPMWPVARSGEPEAKRMRRVVAFGGEEDPRSRGPSGPLRSSKNGKIAPLRSRRTVIYGCAR